MKRAVLRFRQPMIRSMIAERFADECHIEPRTIRVLRRLAARQKTIRREGCYVIGARANRIRLPSLSLLNWSVIRSSGSIANFSTNCLMAGDEASEYPD